MTAEKSDIASVKSCVFLTTYYSPMLKFQIMAGVFLNTLTVALPVIVKTRTTPERFVHVAVKLLLLMTMDVDKNVSVRAPSTQLKIATTVPLFELVSTYKTLIGFN